MGSGKIGVWFPLITLFLAIPATTVFIVQKYLTWYPNGTACLGLCLMFRFISLGVLLVGFIGSIVLKRRAKKKKLPGKIALFWGVLGHFLLLCFWLLNDMGLLLPTIPNI